MDDSTLIQQTMQESTLVKDLDHVASRVCVAGIGGVLSGAVVALNRGHIVSKTAHSMGWNWALAAAACLSTQRLALAGFRYQNDGVITPTATMVSHGVGGVLGGGILGGLFIQKPLRGVVFAVPMMLGIGMLELKFQEEKRVDPEERKKKELKPTRTVDGGLVYPRPQQTLEDRWKK